MDSGAGALETACVPLTFLRELGVVMKRILFICHGRIYRA